MLAKFCIGFLIMVTSVMATKIIVDPQLSLNAPEIIKSHGYPVEIHTVTTNDGYVLTLHRIPHGKHDYNNTFKKKRIPALLMHGYFRSSIDWVMTDPNQNLAFLLANNDYDVWLGNIRGGIYALNHNFFDVESAAFWNFTVDDVSFNDIPATLDYILHSTRSKDLFYLGYSASANYFFNLATSRVEYNGKIRAAVIMAPVTKARKIQGHLMPFVRRLLIYKTRQGSPQVSLMILGYIGRRICNYERFANGVCKSLFYLIFDIMQTLIPALTNHAKSVSTILSAQLLSHAITGELRRDDLGPMGNLMRYGQLTPPKYNLSLMTTPTYILHGSNDPYTNADDVKRIIEKLPASIGEKKIDGYMHLDYAYSKNILDQINLKILSVFNMFK